MKTIIIYYPDDLAATNGNAEGGIYTNISFDDLITEYGIKEENVLLYIPMTISGKTYQDRKEDLRNKAIEWSNTLGYYPAWSYGELADIQGYFENGGKKYGLLAEFHENAIC